MSVRWTTGLLGALALSVGCSVDVNSGGGGTVTADATVRNDIPGGASCASATNCGACTAMGACGWCGRTGRCMAGTSSGSGDTTCGGADWAWTSSRCGADGGVLPPVDAAAQCATATNCASCTAMGSCGWCGRTGRCMAGGSMASGDMSCGGADWAWLSSRCSADGGVLPPVDAAAQCAMATNCGACTAMGSCGWCGRTGRCMQGTATASGDMSCGSPDWAWISSRCGADGGVLPPRDAGPECTGVPRSCGLTLAGGVRTCTAGQMVTIGCNSGCSPALGMCTGDAVMQICPSTSTTAACNEMTAIASNDDATPASMCRGDAGTNLCPVTTFTCPTNGMYTVWVGAYDATETATCVPAVR
ncbi:MAG: hypothetical protein R3A48_07640 [Polyangiales bacterium]